MRTKPNDRMCRTLPALWRRTEGAVAIEAAIIVPFLLVILVTLVDMVRYFETATRMDRVATTAADLITRGTVLYDRTDFKAPENSQDLAMFFLAANQTAQPDDLAGRGRVIVTSVTLNSSGPVTNWQRTGPYGLAATSRLGTLPDLPDADSYIITEVFYTFRPIILDALRILPAAQTVIYRRAIYQPRLATLTSLTAAK